MATPHLAAAELPIPPHFAPSLVGQVWRVPYQTHAPAARQWAQQYHITPASQDQQRLCLLIIDAQNTFCIPEFELFVGGRSGTGAVDDNRRLCEFIYRNLARLTVIIPTLDTHQAMQIFHPVFWCDESGNHPPAMTMISLEDVQANRWQVNLTVADSLGMSADALTAYARHYVESLNQAGKYPLTIWPYHSMLGGIGHSLVAAIEEAAFFHSMARQSQTQFELKGNHPLTENYSVLRPEVMGNADGKAIAQKNNRLIQQLLTFDGIVIAGQAQSHCVAWTVDDLLTEIQAVDPTLAQKVYLLEDCTSPVVVPGVVDFTPQAEASFARFAAAGMHIVRSTEPMANWLPIPE
ncbi:MAG: isochorismatase [Pseudanabaenaceae cyanobacterium]